MTPIVKTKATSLWIQPNPYPDDSFWTDFSDRATLLIKPYVFDENSFCVQQPHDNGHSCCRHPTRARCIVAESSVYQTQIYNLLNQSLEKYREFHAHYFSLGCLRHRYSDQ